MTWLQTLAINLPSDVPPFVLTVVSRFVTLFMDSLHIFKNSFLVVRNGSPECFHWRSYFVPTDSITLIIFSFNSSAFVSVDYLTLKASLILPGMTLSTPVPALILDIWKEVGGKNSLPLSKLIFSKSDTILELRWIGLFAFSG